MRFSGCSHNTYHISGDNEGSNKAVKPKLYLYSVFKMQKILKGVRIRTGDFATSVPCVAHGDGSYP